MTEIDYMTQLVKSQRQIRARTDRLATTEFCTIVDPAISVPITLATIQALTGLRGFWAGGTANDTKVTDLSGGAQHLTRNGSVGAYHTQIGTPATLFSGSGQWLYSADGAHWDIDGTETDHPLTQRGLTLGAWVFFDSTASTREYAIAKRHNTSQRAYWLARESDGTGLFGIGDTVYEVDSGSDTIGPITWTYLVGRFDPSTELALWVNSTKYTNTTSIPASISATTADLFLGGRDDGTTPGQDLLTGRIAFAWICSVMLSDALIERIYSVSRHCLTGA